MSNVQRMCVQCGEGNPVESRYCAQCGYDSQSALPAQRASLPAVIGQAALPLLVGAAGLAVRVGWKFLQNRLAQASQAALTPAPKGQQPIIPVPRPPAQHTEIVQTRHVKRTVHIRSSWAVNTNGVWQQGTSEHTIEVDE